MKTQICVLFLDVDGVLNCHADFDPDSPEYKRSMGYVMNDRLIAHVQRIVEATGCKVVLSSSWRLSPDGRREVSKHFELYDVTPDKRGLTDRGCEVREWLEDHPDVHTYAILDDNTDFHQEQPLFRTETQVGITEAITDVVIAHLKEKSPVGL